MSKRVTIIDIAKETKTSPSTVSRVLSYSGYPVKEEVKNLIINTAKEMNYTPNVIGRMLKQNKSMDIGVIIPTISNPFYPSLVLGIEVEARLRGYNILLCNSLRDIENEKKYIEMLYQKQVGGIIISSVGQNEKLIGRLLTMGLKIVSLDEEINFEGISTVGFDYVKGGMLAVEHLWSQGHKNIAFVSSPLTKKSRIQTFEGYKLALYKHGLEFREDNVMVSEKEEENTEGTYEFENGKMLAKRIGELKDKPTGIFACNDMTAIGLINGLTQKGIKVPDDISVVGFDNIEMSSMINPPLTTVNQPSYETGKLSSKILLDNMEGKESSFSVTLEPSIVIRESTISI